MLATNPIVTFLLVLVIGIIIGVLFDRLAGPSWLARQFSGFHPRHRHERAGRCRRRLRRLSHRTARIRRQPGGLGHRGGGRRRCGAVRVADDLSRAKHSSAAFGVTAVLCIADKRGKKASTATANNSSGGVSLHSVIV